jgi:7-cyano-7-deazaguanine synthase
MTLTPATGQIETGRERAVVLVSGGLDSATTLAIARAEGYACYALSFAYGQRHGAELKAARKLTSTLGAVEHRVMSIDLAALGGSALTDASIDVPVDGPGVGIPVTYVPARNIVFLSLALAWAEVLEARNIFIGVNSIDYSGYPDCRPEFIRSFEDTANLATRAGVDGSRIRVLTPLGELTKAQIIRRGLSLGLEYAQTVSCYQADDEGRACGRCDSCRIRREGFANAQVEDPTHYQ